MSGGHISKLMQIWAACNNGDPPFADHEDLYRTIDSTQLGEVPWRCFSVSYTGEIPEGGDPPPWMSADYEVWWRDPDAVLSQQISNPSFAGEMDFAPKQVKNESGEREYKDFMSGDWAWKQAVSNTTRNAIATDWMHHQDDIYAQNGNLYQGTTFCPVILGSDKTTTSVATGNHEYYPLYISNGLVHNNVRRAHRNAVSLLGFLAIPKSGSQFLDAQRSPLTSFSADKEYAADPKFRRFRRQLFHSSLNRILQPLLPGMTEPLVKVCADGHFRKIVYGLGPYIADYPEQALLACIVQGWCARYVPLARS